MFTAAFWRASAERALKSAAQFAVIVVGQDVIGWDKLQATASTVGAAALSGALVSLLTSIASAQIGTHGSPSLAPDAEIEAATDS